VLTVDEIEKCRNLFKIFESYVIYKYDEVEVDYIETIESITDAPPEAQKAYEEWLSIARPVNEDGSRIDILLTYDDIEKCHVLGKIFKPYSHYKYDENDEERKYDEFKMVGVTEMPPSAQKAYEEWINIAQPVDEDGNRLMV
jgi:hypothetical protein